MQKRSGDAKLTLGDHLEHVPMRALRVTKEVR